MHDRRRDFLPAIRILSSFRPCSQSEMNWKIFRCVIFSGICYFRWKMYWNRHGYSDRCMNPNNISEVVYYFLQDKGAEYRGDLLYERAKAEFDARMEELAALPPKEILDHAYEKIIKEDFLCHLEEGLDEWETDALLSYPQPLAALYTEWMGVDYSYLDIDRIQSTAKQAAGKRLNELRRHEFDVNGEPPAELRYFYDLHSEILDNPDLEWVGDMEP